MGIALLGHGGLELAGGYPEGMGVVAIGPGTTLQVFTDTGQSLILGNDLDVFSKLQAPWPAMDSSNVTYNLELTYDDGNAAVEQEQPGFFAQVLAPHTPVFAGVGDAPSPFLLCTGTPQGCPTDPRMSTGEVEGPREHSCDGILGRYKGQQLLWLACTVVYSAGHAEAEAVAASLGGAAETAVLGTNPDDPLPTWYVLERDAPDGVLESWFDEQNDAVKDYLRSDQHIAEWEQNRTY